MFACRTRTVVAVACILGSATNAVAEQRANIDGAVEMFGSQCASAIAAPEEFYFDALAGGDESPFMVTLSDDGQIHEVIRMTQPTMLFVRLGEVDGRTHVHCRYSFGFDPSQEATDARNDEFLAAIARLEGATTTGGAMEVRGILSKYSGNPHTVYEYLVNGWPDMEQIVLADIQEGVFTLAVDRMLPRPLSLEQ